MAGPTYTVVRGIVLRETETQETDKILTLLTDKLGKVSAIARGARRKGCKFAASAQSLVWSEWTLYRKKDWFYVHEGETLELFSGLRKDLDAMALGFYFAELTEAVTTEGEGAGEILRHLLNGLYALGQLRKPPALVKPAFELRLMCLAGYEPLAGECVCCGAEHPREPVLDVVQGNTPDRKNEVFAQISESRVGRAIRTPEYLYSVYAPGLNGGVYGASAEYADDFLYDLTKDPNELNNLIHDESYRAVKEMLRARLLDQIEQAEHTRPVIRDDI